MHTVKTIFAAGFLLATVVVSACGTSDDAGGGDPASGGDTGGASPGAEGAASGASTFPGYVQQLIETGTNATSLPELESVWSSIPDDERYMAPPRLFDAPL